MLVARFLHSIVLCTFPYSVGVSWRLCSCGVGLVQSVDVVMESRQCNPGDGVCVSLPLQNKNTKTKKWIILFLLVHAQYFFHISYACWKTSAFHCTMVAVTISIELIGGAY